MATINYLDPKTGEYKKVVVPGGGGGVDIPASDTPPEKGDYWLNTSAQTGKFYNAEEVDGLLETTASEFNNKLQRKVNPNLLHNWYFVDPVNQRGRAEYTGAGYTIDRWRATNADTITNIEDGSILLTTSSTWTNLRQLIEFPERLKEKTITLSFLVDVIDNDLFAAVQRVRDNAESLLCEIKSNRMGLQLLTKTLTPTDIVPTDQLRVRIGNGGQTGTKRFRLYAIKLELGSEQTLAHNEGTEEEPIWVLNEIPDKGIELLKCIQSKADPADTYANKVIATGHMCNKNLLDNWYFGNADAIVDQRQGYIAPVGITFYNDSACTSVDIVNSFVRAATYVNNEYGTVKTGENNQLTKYIKFSDMVRGYTGNTHAMDRWASYHSSITAEIVSDGVKISSSATSGSIQWGERIEDFISKSVVGRTITVSAICNEVVGSSHNLLIRFADENNAYISAARGMMLGNDLTTFSAIVPVNCVKIFVGCERTATESSVNDYAVIKAIKLELGTEQTLAYQDTNGNWVLNEIPNYAEELAKCQRYQNIFPAKTPYAQFGMAIATSETAATAQINLSNMRVAPTKFASSGKFMLYDGINHPISTIAKNDQSTTNVLVLNVTSSGLVKGCSYVLSAENDTSAQIVAESNL